MNIKTILIGLFVTGILISISIKSGFVVSAQTISRINKIEHTFKNQDSLLFVSDSLQKEVDRVNFENEGLKIMLIKDKYAK